MISTRSAGAPGFRRSAVAARIPTASNSATAVAIHAKCWRELRDDASCCHSTPREAVSLTYR